MDNKEQIDFLAVGDIVIDNFIDLIDAKVIPDDNGEDKLIAMRFGDKIPYKDAEEIAAVGNSPNAAVSAARLGLKSALMTHIGNDDNGAKCLHVLEENGVDTKFVQTQAGFDTNYHFVLRKDAERTILIKHAQFNYDFPMDMPAPRWIYFSSVAENSLPYHHQIAKYVKNNPEVKLAFQPGTFQIKLGAKELKDIYEVTELFFCNKEEAQRILETKEDDIKELLKKMCKLGPKIICITDGANGAYAYNGEAGWFMPMYPDPAKPVDRTGAGDSFSSTFTSALALGKTIDEALAWGPINSMSVVQYVGAQAGLLSREKLEEHLAKAPKEYKAKQII